MDKKYEIGLNGHGGVVLGPDIICDGFDKERRVRVQTHIHSDHLEHFERSKGYQNIYMSPASYDLLVLSKNAELKFRRNLIKIENEQTININGNKLTVLSSGHMVGANQVQVCLPGGKTIGYSGDFDWPIEKIIKVDTLLVDCTNGSPRRKVKYNRIQAYEKLVELIIGKIKRGPIELIAHRGTLQHALEFLCSETDIPFVGSDKTCSETDIYRKYGYSIPEIINVDSDEGQRIIKDGRYINVLRVWEKNSAISSKNTRITISAYYSDFNNPVIEISSSNYMVSLSKHADFTGTIEYIKATGAKEVITDSYRGSHSWDLALEVQKILGIKAKPALIKYDYGWGE